MKLQNLVIVQEGEISKEKAGLLSRKLVKLLNNPEFFVVVDAMVQQEAEEHQEQQTPAQSA